MAAELDPQAPQMQYNLGFTYFRMNRFEDAKSRSQPLSHDDPISSN
jgi:hypothetical protein